MGGVGLPRDDLAGRLLTDFLAASETDRIAGWLDRAPVPEDPVRINFASAADAPFTLRCLVERGDGRLRLVGEPEAEDGRAATEVQLLKPQAGDATHAFLTAWENREAFQRYMKSREHAISHGREPGEIMARTEVRHEAYEVLIDSRDEQGFPFPAVDRPES